MTRPYLSPERAGSTWDEEYTPDTRRRGGAPEPRFPAWLWLLIAVPVLGAGAALAWFLLQEKAEPQPAQAPAPEVKRTPIPNVRNIFIETQGNVRRVVLLCEVVHREGQLEGLLTRARTKEHEYILAFDGDAIHIHTALLGIGAEAGSPVKFEPRYIPATGSTIKATVRYEKGGKMVSHPAQEWIQNINTKKQLAEDWVFGGSQLVADMDNPQRKIYVANYGDIICLCNMDSAMMDLPIRSPKRFDDRIYHAFTERIPPFGTKVELILEPVKK